ncbi:MAG: ParB/RepB/Spo0J family partition protein [Parasporobacterium sp.]|nr:ParB/RepB/Spo0J family partition protein [Parasporobacterium sp.]MCR4684633.1 ParB/RepB/Spo0J family partition protein [Lachnospiraceae bacterium]
MAARGLGKGLDALIPQETVPVKKEDHKAEKKNNDGVEYVKISLVEPNPDQPRRTFNEDELQELADSIKQFGVIQPILVQDKKNKDHYMIVAGERRWRASRIAGLKEVPVIIRNYTAKEILEISLIENLQRKDINTIDEAIAYKRLMTEFKMTHDEIAERVSKSRTAITNTIRLLNLSDQVQEMVINDMISPGHARALLGIENPEEQYNVALKVFDEKLSVRDIEKLVKKLNDPTKKEETKDHSEFDYLYRDLEEKMKISLGTKVSIRAKDAEKGKIEIEYYSKDELERLSDFLMGIAEE